VAAGVGGLALILATGRWPGLWALACLAAWGGVAAARLAWQIVRQQAQQGEPLLLGDQLLDWYCQGFWVSGHWVSRHWVAAGGNATANCKN